MTTEFKKWVPDQFTNPEQLPASPDEEDQWQEANRAFWESNPMRYDWKEKVGFEEFSKEFYEEIDSRFFDNVKEYMPWKNIPFDNLIDFAGIGSKSVLEIGVGNGSHAQLLATHAKSFTGIDITEYAVRSTNLRMQVSELKAEIKQMDAEHLEFPDSSFDFIWSWGVIHHSSNTEQIIKEMYRVLKPEGEAVTMVYHRGWWTYYVFSGILQGLKTGDLLKTGSLAKTVQMNTDGALARYYTPNTWKKLMERNGFRVEYVQVKGSKAELFPIPSGRFKSLLMRLVPSVVTRFLTNQCRMGSFLIAKVRKL